MTPLRLQLVIMGAKVGGGGGKSSDGRVGSMGCMVCSGCIGGASGEKSAVTPDGPPRSVSVFLCHSVLVETTVLACDHTIIVVVCKNQWPLMPGIAEHPEQSPSTNSTRKSLTPGLIPLFLPILHSSDQLNQQK